MEQLPPVIATDRVATPVTPPPGSPDALRRAGVEPRPDIAPAPDGTDPAITSPLAGQSPVEVLDFVGTRTVSVPLSCPFRRGGGLVEAITVRRLITNEIAGLLPGDGTLPGVYAIYAVMCDLPEAVLRGLDGDDGMAVSLACADFLPRQLRRALGFSTSGSGDTPPDA